MSTRGMLFAGMGAMLAGCGGGGRESPDADTQLVDAAGVAVDATPEPVWTELVRRPWSSPASTEEYWCKTFLLEDDLFISGFRGFGTAGTFELYLSVDNVPQAVGEYECPNGPLVPGQKFLYASGVGTDDLVMPSGVAVRALRGRYLTLWVHTRTAAEPLTGEAGVMIQTISYDEVVHEAGMWMLGLRSGFTIAADGQPHDIATDCGIPLEWTIFDLWPHMHTAGTHFKLENFSSPDTTLILDAPSAPLEQVHHALDLAVRVNDRIILTCTFVNNTGAPIAAGPAQGQEECMAAVYHYPWNDNATPYFCAMI